MFFLHTYNILYTIQKQCKHFKIASDKLLLKYREVKAHVIRKTQNGRKDNRQHAASDATSRPVQKSTESSFDLGECSSKMIPHFIQFSTCKITLFKPHESQSNAFYKAKF
jgi:hypothetical protein